MMFKFGLLENAKIKVSEEIGEVIGRAEFSMCENRYLLRYCDGTGRAVDAWWDESALVKP